MRGTVLYRASSCEAVAERKVFYDKKSCVREFDVGDIVWNRLQGMDHKLSEAWSGP